jgi:hypothetical protein
MEQSLQGYWDAVQRKVCQKCIDGDGHGNCRLGTVDECALKVYLPQIVEVVLATRSPHIDPYVQGLRQKVCGGCRHQSAEGNCLLRNEADCALDRYFPLVVEVIEEMRQQGGEKPDATGARQ